MITYLFPGQGAQKRGMGANVLDQFQELTQSADKILGYSIKELCLNSNEETLSLTNNAQSALFVVGALNFLTLKNSTKSLPDFVAGHSLGEYNALFAAGAFDFETGLQLVKKRGELMARAEDGGMAAIIGLSGAQISDILLSNNLHNTIDIANYNTPEQIVVSGKKESILKAKEIFENSGAKMYIILKVGGAFHSRYMQEAADEFREFVSSFSFERLQIPVIANTTALPYKNKDIVDNLANQIKQPVRWDESMYYLLNQSNMIFKEIGDSTILTNMLKKLQPINA